MNGKCDLLEKCGSAGATVLPCHFACSTVFELQSLSGNGSGKIIIGEEILQKLTQKS